MESKRNRNENTMPDRYFCGANQETASRSMRRSLRATTSASTSSPALWSAPTPSSGPGSLVNRQSSPLNNSLIPSFLKMRFTSIPMAGVAALTAIFSFMMPSTGQSQTFSRAVVVMSGTVHSDESGKPTSVKVSIREVGDTAREITQSTSNKETGKYLVVLQPGKKYWVHLEGDSILTKDEMIDTPIVQQTQQLKRDFSVIMREAEDATKSTLPLQQN
jgi:hypothetical protein